MQHVSRRSQGQTKLKPFQDLTPDDFLRHRPTGKFIYITNGELWPASSVDASTPGVPTGKVDKDGEPVVIPASSWISRYRPAFQIVWAPGEEKLIYGKLAGEAGWIDESRAIIFNSYRPAPKLTGGIADKATPWTDHVKRLFPKDADHIFKYLAHTVRHVGNKINHALCLFGEQGCGKDTIVVPICTILGVWNTQTIDPPTVLGRFNGFRKCALLLIEEVRNTGEQGRYAFMQACKTIVAAPPDFVRVDEKNMKEVYVANINATVMYSNELLGGLLLTEDDRRHYIAATEVTKEQLFEKNPNYFPDLYNWYEEGGVAHVAAFLDTVDLSDFNPKAPPPKTPAFWNVIHANASADKSDLEELLEKISGEMAKRGEVLKVITIEKLASSTHCPYELREFLRDRAQRWKVPQLLEERGFPRLHNPATKQGLWTIGDKKVAIYGNKAVPIEDRVKAAQLLTGGNK
ncbi:hypothetical protein IB262_21190 [Ensifer sp. ENS02]|uniref:primase-helicase family protein n=1 Tax=Ensifer sp. ENS02 TaxID=2769290 RepID=UPI001781F609|nr:primase-helicase family protein [Ensifer sp. ENS02]MBD9522414.1 hypothetical protein [Ensifer sp. ENS02]